MNAPAALDDFSVTLRIPVQWGEMDAYGHLNNTVFFRYFESARIGYLEACGFTRSYEEEGIGAILHSTRARFRRPVQYPDEVDVGGRVVELGQDRFTMEYRVVSRELGAVAADGEGLVVAFDYGAGRKAPLPPAVREGVLRLDGHRLDAS